MKKFLIFILIFLFPATGQAFIKKGDPAPDFFLVTQDGKTVQLYQLKAKVILIEFLSTKCFACDYVIPDINRLYEKFGRKDVQIVGILFDDEVETIGQLNEFAKTREIKYPLYLGNTKIKKLYNVFGFPNFFILNEKKQVVHIYRGITQDTFGLLNKDLEKLLSGR